MNLVNYNPVLRTQKNILDQFDIIFDFLYFGDKESYSYKRPNVNYFDDDSKYVVCVELPGVEKEHISLNVSDSLLKLDAERYMLHSDDESNDKNNTKLSYCYEVRLPEDIELNKVKGHFNNGILNIDIPKVKSKGSMSKKIKID